MTWDTLLDQMTAELRSASPRADAYWAQQLAFGPVLFHALSLRVRDGVPADDLPHLRRVLLLAMRGLGTLPEAADGAALSQLARRQASALASGRRTQLRRMATRLQVDPPPIDVVPTSFLRAYPVIGWKPPGNPPPAC